MEQESLFVAINPPRAFVRVHGRGSFQVSPDLKKFFESAMRNGCREVIVDMQACLGMDSTFMGVLAGIAMRLRKQSPAGVAVMINLDAKNNGLLETLGLARVVRLIRAPLSEDQRLRYGLPPDSDALGRLDAQGADRELKARTMLDAHEDLVAVAPDNLPRFKDVLTYLREEVRRNAGDGQG